MGKVFDALEKSKKEEKPLVSSNEDSCVEVKEKTESRERSIEEAESTRKHMNIDKNLVTLLKPQSFEAEQFKMLRTNILFPASGNPPRSIMVTSAVPGEGKTFVSANLAVSIARNINEYVMLLDCDIRRPSIHTCFGYGDVPGLSSYLSDGTSISSLLLKPEVNKLTILPGGEPPHNPSELLSSNKMVRFLEEIKERYVDRYIIIDSPPPQLAPETSALARHVDGILVVIKYGSTSRDLVTNLIDMMGKEKILGIIVNRFNISSSLYSSYGKYRKYGKYYGK